MLRIIIFDLNVKVKLKVLESKKQKMKSGFKALIRIFIVIFSTRWRKNVKVNWSLGFKRAKMLQKINKRFLLLRAHQVKNTTET
jgi:hypothetical protein